MTNTIAHFPTISNKCILVIEQDEYPLEKFYGDIAESRISVSEFAEEPNTSLKCYFIGYTGIHLEGGWAIFDVTFVL